jgi:hypothetical protein
MRGRVNRLGLLAAIVALAACSSTPPEAADDWAFVTLGRRARMPERC